MLENQRALFAQERQLWESERRLLKSRISELEMSAGNDGRKEEMKKENPVWMKNAPPTRVFPSDDDIASLDAASPRSSTVDPNPSTLPPAIPVEMIDSTLDGINLKSSAITPEVAVRVASSSSSPPSSAQAEAEPSQQQQGGEKRRQSMKNPLNLKLDLGRTTTDKNLVMDAGHTPMPVFDEKENNRNEQEEEEEDDDDDDDGYIPPVQPPSTRRPTESSVTYFPNNIDPDPALKGPLSLLNDKNHDDAFLDLLDAKLLNQGYDEDEREHEPEPELRFKKNTTNFGSAFGEFGV